MKKIQTPAVARAARSPRVEVAASNPLFTVELSKAQHRLFEVLAEGMGAKPGDLILALACRAIDHNCPGVNAYSELAELLWDYVARRQTPEADEWLSDEEIATLVLTAGYKRQQDLVT